jgi:hypothetical protein
MICSISLPAWTTIIGKKEESASTPTPAAAVQSLLGSVSSRHKLASFSLRLTPPLVTPGKRRKISGYPPDDDAPFCRGPERGGRATCRAAPCGGGIRTNAARRSQHRERLSCLTRETRRSFSASLSGYFFAANRLNLRQDKLSLSQSHVRMLFHRHPLLDWISRNVPRAGCKLTDPGCLPPVENAGGVGPKEESRGAESH